MERGLAWGLEGLGEPQALPLAGWTTRSKRSLPLSPHLPQERGAGMASGVLSSPEEAGSVPRRVLLASASLSLPSVLPLVFALPGVPLGMSTVFRYTFSFHSFCRQAKKKKEKLSPPPISARRFKPSESCTQASLLPARCNILANEKLISNVLHCRYFRTNVNGCTAAET